MTSTERHEARYQRRIAKRLVKKNAKLSRLGDYDSTFTYDKLYEAFYKCRQGVRWKSSIQNYEATLLLSTLSIYNTMKSRDFKPMGFLEFDLNERGKMRHIRALKIPERCIQRCLCDHYLNPILEKQLIYDNGASIKGKGESFSIKRLKCHLSRYYRRYHTNEGYALQFDFKSFFDNIDHNILLRLLRQVIPDFEILKVVEKMVRCFGNKGLGLGSQVSQICAIFYPTLIDRFIKEDLKIKEYDRYMDDGILLCRTLEQVKKCKDAITAMCNKLHIVLNEKKLVVTKLSNTFIFLKKRFKLTSTGKVIVRIGRQTVVRARRRLKKLANKVFDSTAKFYITDLRQCFKSYIGSIRRYQNYFITQNYRKLYLQLLSACNKQTQLNNIIQFRCRRPELTLEEERICA